MASTIEFTVLGVAAPQGSKVKTKWGAMREANPRTMPWRQEVAAVAKAAMRNRGQVLGPVRLRATFMFPRPKGHFRTGKRAGELKDSAPDFMQTKPDLSKLVRAIEDAMTGIVYRDDSQISMIEARKVYSASVPRTTITVEELT